MNAVTRPSGGPEHGPRVMGVLNVTPDSFSDGGRYVDAEAALARGREMVAQGAHLIDVGGESTRPGASRVEPEEEQRRVLPVVEALASENIAVSIDTVHASTARLAVAAGASMINDVSGGTADPLMHAVAAETGVRYIAMHWRGIPDPAHSRSSYADVVSEVRDGLARLAEAASAAGVQPERLILDPGLGFDKTAAQGWQLLAALPRLASLGHPLLVGVSRKRMLGETLAARGLADDLPLRDLSTAVVSALAAREGVWGVRVHEVVPTVTALAIADAWGRGVSSPSGQGVANGWMVAPQTTTRDALLEERDALFEESEANARQGEARIPADRIALTGLEVFAHHGVFGFEREQGQRFVIDAEIALDLRPAAQGDELASTVHYGELAVALKQAAERDPVDLIETLAERLAQVALGFAAVERVRITVHKPDAPIDAEFGDVCVTVVRRAIAARDEEGDA